MQDYPRRLFGFDSQALIQLIGGLVIGLIAIYTSYDQINLGNRSYPINQQWGIWFIAASRWRLWLSNSCNRARLLGATLNWPRDPDVERRIAESKMRAQQLRKETELLDEKLRNFDALELRLKQAALSLSKP